MDGILVVSNNDLHPSNVINYAKNLLKSIEHEMNAVPKDVIKNKLNSFTLILSQQSYTAKIKHNLRFLISHTLIMYGQIYNNPETFKNVIQDLISIENKTVLSSLYPFEYKYNLAFALFGLFNCKLNINKANNLNYSELSELIQAKFYLLRIYSHHVHNKNRITENNLLDTINLLVVILIQLSRWPEALGYLRNIENENAFNVNQIRYSKALVLSEIRKKTCLDYNGLFLISIKDLCLQAKNKKSMLLPIQKNNLIKINNEINLDIKKYNINIKNIRKHQKVRFYAVFSGRKNTDMWALKWHLAYQK